MYTIFGSSDVELCKEVGKIQFYKTDSIRWLAAFNVTKQIAFEQRDLHSTSEFERAMDRRCQALVSKLETLDPSLLPNWIDTPKIA